MTDYLVRAISDGEVLDSETVSTEDDNDAHLAYLSMEESMESVWARTPGSGDITVQLINSDTDDVLRERTFNL